MRILLFLATNLAVILVASFTLRLLGVDSYLSQHGIQYGPLLAFAAVFGFAGAIISLLISKPMAKWSTKAKIIESPRTPAERWLMETVADLAKNAGIGMPDVAIFPASQSNAFATGWNKNDALVAVSEGLLHRFNKDEIRAVLGHEIGHVANGDMVTLALIQGGEHLRDLRLPGNRFVRRPGHLQERVATASASSWSALPPKSSWAFWPAPLCSGSPGGESSGLTLLAHSWPGDRP